jgi:hypothetical protein
MTRRTSRVAAGVSVTKRRFRLHHGCQCVQTGSSELTPQRHPSPLCDPRTPTPHQPEADQPLLHVRHLPALLVVLQVVALPPPVGKPRRIRFIRFTSPDHGGGDAAHARVRDSPWRNNRLDDPEAEEHEVLHEGGPLQVQVMDQVVLLHIKVRDGSQWLPVWRHHRDT